MVNLENQKHISTQLKSEISGKVLKELGGIWMQASIPIQNKKAVHTKLIRMLSTCFDQAKRMKQSQRESAEIYSERKAATQCSL